MDKIRLISIHFLYRYKGLCNLSEMNRKWVDWGPYGSNEESQCISIKFPFNE